MCIIFVYLNLWILAGISLLNISLFLIWCIGIGSVEPLELAAWILVVDNILGRYIGIGGVEPLLVKEILRRYIGIGGVKPLVVDILIFFYSKR